MKTFKKLILILTVSIGLWSCKRDTSLDLSGIYSLKKNDTEKIPNGAYGATVTATDITDNLCPPNAICTTGGYASATLKFKDADQTQTVEICMGDCATTAKPYAHSIILNGQMYSIFISGVSDQSDAKKTVTFRLSRSIAFN